MQKYPILFGNEKSKNVNIKDVGGWIVIIGYHV